MHLKYRNVNEAFIGLVSGIHSGEIPVVTRASRAGEVMMVEQPMIITYDQPKERVLFNQERDCNPFFHLIEAMWMLAGHNDVASLVKYNSKMQDFSDNGKTFNGAYGYRWRKRNTTKDWEFPDESIDQLDLIIDHLKQNPESRRAVLQMWNVEDDLLNINDSKDVCCNTHVYFSVELGMCLLCEGNSGPMEDGSCCPECNGKPHNQPHYLNMTVCNRSNDLIWGMLGANVVHFSYLQEYIACSLELEVGTYNQITNNLHVYTDKWKPKKWLENYSNQINYDDVDDPSPIPLLVDREQFDKECQILMEYKGWYRAFKEPFLKNVVGPMCWAFELHKHKKYRQAITTVNEKVHDYGWRIAGINWLEKRKRIWRKKNEIQSGIE